MEEKSTEKKSYYGKRPLWQWIVLYVVIGGIVYAAVYFLFLSKRGGYNYNYGSSPSTQQNPYNYNSK